MKKFLLSLIGVIMIGSSAYADTIKFTPADLKKSNSSNSYVTTAFAFSAEGCDFKAQQVNPSTGQMRVNNTLTNAVQFWNTSAIENITKITLTADASTLGTWYMAIGDSEISSTATTKDIKGTNSGNSVVFTVPSDTKADFFHVNLTAKGSGTVKFTSVEIEYNPGGVVKTPVTLTWEPSEQTLKLGEAFVAPVLNVEPAEAASAVTLTAEGLISIDENGQMVLDEGKAGTATVTASIESEEYYATSTDFNLTVIDPNAIKDVITAADFTTITNSSYFTRTYESSTSGITYKARMINDGSNIQMNATEGFYITENPNDLIISNITVTFASKTTSGRSVKIYAAPEVPESPMSITNQIAEFKMSDGVEQSIAPDEDYKGLFMSVTGATYLSSIVIEYREGDSTPKLNPNLSFEATQYEMFAGDSFDGLKLNSDYEVAPIAYTSSNPSVATVDEATGTISALTVGTTTITATFEGNDEYRKSTASYTLTVVAAPYTNLKDVVTTAVKDEKVTIVGNFAVLYKSGSNTILTDGTSNILCYDYNLASYEVGTPIDRIEGTVSPYFELFQLTSVTLTEGGNGATIDPVELTSFDSINYTDNLFDLVAVNGAEISELNGKQATLELNGQSIALYNNFNIDNFSNLENVNLTGFVWRNNSTLQIDPISIVENTVEKIESGLAWTASEFTVMEGEEPEGYPTLINELGIDVVFTSSNEGVAIYEDGMLLIDEVGTAVITATPADTETYSGSAEFTVTVTAKPHLGAITVNGRTVADDDVISIVVNTEVTFAAENAEIIEYEIAGPEGFEASDIVDADSYTFTPAAIGEYIVSISATGCNEGAEATFTINVTEVPAITEETLDFVNNEYGMNRNSNTSEEIGIVLADTEFTYTVSGSSLWSDGMRMYSSHNAEIVVEAPAGYVLSAVEPWTETDRLVTANGISTSIAAGHASGKVIYTGSGTYKLKKLHVEVEKVEAPEVEGYSPELVYNDNVQTSTDEITGAITIIITHADKHASIYFKHTPDEVPAEVRRRIADHGDYTAADATLHDDGTSSVHTFTVPSAGTVDYYAYHAATDTKGELKSISVSADGGVTSISEITLDSNADANAIYDLQGRRVAKAARGLYISNGHKVYLR